MSGPHEKPEDLIARVRAILPWHVRLRWGISDFFKWIVRPFLSRYIPGYRAASLAIWRMKLQGLSGIWTPAFDISKQDFAIFDKRLRWHGWGVLRENAGFRAYTPTSRTVSLFLSTQAAWVHLETVYWKGADATGIRWEERP